LAQSSEGARRAQETLDRRTATLCRPDQPEQRFEARQTLEFPDLLPGFAALVERFFA
jgi:hypothetical protein